MDPDTLVATHGDPVTITRVVSATVGQDGVSAVTREFEHTLAVLSSPTDDDTQRPEGRSNQGDLTATVQSETDVAVERQGGRDRVIEGHVNPATAEDVDAYSVVEISDDTHNFANIRKVTATCERWTGTNLQDDARGYLNADTDFGDTRLQFALGSAIASPPNTQLETRVGSVVVD